MEQSMLFTVLSLSEFFSTQFPQSDWYPYWYLGNPYHYLIGPVVPMLLSLLALVFPLSFYHLYLLLIGLSILVTGAGVYFFLKAWGISKYHALFAGIFFVLLPGHILLLYTQNGLKHVALSVVPFLFLVYLRYLRKESPLHIFLLCGLLILILLINAASVLPVIIGFAGIFLALSRSKEKDVFLDETHFIKTVLIVLLAVSLATFWYTPGYWWVVLTNPSFGGVPLAHLFWNIFNSLLSFLPLIVAFLLVKWRKYALSGVRLFSLLFFTSFVLLTLFRFAGDPDFIIDWIGFGLELQLGGVLLVGTLVGKLPFRHLRLRVAMGCFLILFVILSFSAIHNIVSYSKSAYKAEIEGLIKSHESESERAFLSGSSVFWINTLSNVKQVRGGNDGGSVHPFWSHGAYQIREGEDRQLAHDWLQVVGASQALVHTTSSQEPFHDFKHSEKFTNFQVLAEKSGNYFYRIPNASIGRTADESLLSVSPPKNGADKKALDAYVSTLRQPVTLEQLNPETIQVSAQVQDDEVISLAMTYDSRWKMFEGKGTMVRDTMGNMVIVPEGDGQQRFVLRYSRDIWDSVIPLLLSIIVGVLLWRYDRIMPSIRKRLPKLHLGLKDEDENY